MRWQRDEFVISDNRDELDIDSIHHFLRESYWARGIPRTIVERAIVNSLCFGLYRDGKQAGFARAITDYATFAYLADVFILPEFRGRGLGKWLVSCILAHPQLQGLRRLLLATSDAHGLYRQYGFLPPQFPENFLEISSLNVYREKAGG